MGNRPRQIITTALVLKRSNVGESDRVVTLITEQGGKLKAIAKGVRKLTSSRAAYLEPGNVIRCQTIQTAAWPLITQVTLLSDCLPIHSQLPKLRQLSQVLEMFDHLFVEEEPDFGMFERILAIRNLVVSEKPTPQTITTLLDNLIVELGFQHPSETNHHSLSDYIGELSGKPLKSWGFLKVGP